MLTECLGWAATLVFGASYFWRRADVLRAVQMVGATMWVVYGVLVQAPPVVAANLLVLAAAAWTATRQFGKGEARGAAETESSSSAERPRPR